jgi:hypothetical protein
MNRSLLRKITVLLGLTILSGCKTITVPVEKYSQYEFEKSYTLEGDTLKIVLKNPLQCPLRVWVFSPDTTLQNRLNPSMPLVLESKSDTILTYTGVHGSNPELRFSSRLGSTSKEIKPIEMDLPYPKNATYTVIQGNNTNFTHNTDWSRYAFDFNLKKNDTICSSTDGYVVGLVDKYKFSGTGKEWQPFANYLTVYDPVSGVFCQYAHLNQYGSLVKIGDRVQRGQRIALSGNTGQSTEEHLHFSCLVPVNNEDGLKSIPIDFVGIHNTADLKEGDKVRNRQ